MKSLVTTAMAVLFVLITIPQTFASGKIKTLEWQDLVPEGSTLTSVDKIPEWEMKQEQKLLSLKPGEEPKKLPAPLVQELSGKEIKIAGYMVPLDFEATKVKQFMLVPYVGACIHVPPPPGNQIILVESEKGVPVVDLYTPIYITGKLGLGKFSTESAPEIGYSMKLSKVSEYQVEE